MFSRFFDDIRVTGFQTKKPFPHNLGSAGKGAISYVALRRCQEGGKCCISSQAACTRCQVCDICCCRVCCILTPAGRSPVRLVSTSRKSLELSSCWGQRSAACSSSVPPHNQQQKQPHIILYVTPLLLPCLPADDGRFEHGTESSHTTTWRLVLDFETFDPCCALWARHPSPPGR